MSKNICTKLSEFVSLTENTNNDFLYHGSPHTFDKFDITKIGTTEGLTKYGFGFYFTPNYDCALYYAKENSIGKLKDGYNIYIVKLNIDNFINWNDSIESIQNLVTNKLNKLGYDNDAETIENESGDYGYDYWTFSDLYNYLETVFDNSKEVSDFFTKLNINGTFVDSVHAGNMEDTIYVAFIDNIKIIDIEHFIK